ncbi:MAG: hypothetical protein ABJN98_01170 [Roseibium sp.]|uniref:hypothetical protein n=1 Tax=Parasphingorhabdus sp. TaxID=2709688 RepID=UPI0032983D54
MQKIIAPIVIVSLIHFPAIADELPKDRSQTFEQQIKKVRAESQGSPDVEAKIVRLKEQYPRKKIGNPKWQRSGHQYTSFIISVLAGRSLEQSHKLAYYSQLPDDEIYFSATMAFFYLWNIEYRKEIMATLHSLHGGDLVAVERRRNVLKNLISDGIDNEVYEDYELGLMIHAFGDAYSHVKEEDGEVSAFSYTWGHLFHGHKPDIIFYDPPKYREYACALFQSLKRSGICNSELGDLYDMIGNLSSSPDKELAAFEKYAIALGFDADYYKAKSDAWSKLVGKNEVKSVVEVIESHLN